MDEEYLIFADPDGLYPGNIVRSAPPVDWSSLLHASIQRQRHQQQHAKKAQLPSSSSTSSSDARVRNTPPESPASKQPSEDTVPDTEQDEYPDAETNGVKKALLAGHSTAEKIDVLLRHATVDLDALKKIAWPGLPGTHRPACWKLLLGYAPKTASRRSDTIERKRREYREAVAQHYPVNDTANGNDSSSASASAALSPRATQTDDDVMMRQIAVDIPRTSPGQKLFQISAVQLALQRILYVWAMRHPASGYVQGMNDLVTPFLYVFLTEYSSNRSGFSLCDASELSDLSEDADNAEQALSDAEADSYWCLTTLLNDIQDYYTFSQPGIQRRVHFLRDLVSRVDATLCAHLEQEGLDFLQFAFRWMNCLLMRELPFNLIVRVWDTYLAEADGFAVFHVYVCAALLVSFSEKLQQMDFQELVMFLQNLPTEQWSEKNIDIILSQAYMWRTIFGQSPSHLQ